MKPYEGAGVKVMEVIEGGPLLNAKTKIEKGTVIEKIDGEPIAENMDWNKLLNRKGRQECIAEPVQSHHQRTLGRDPEAHITRRRAGIAVCPLDEDHAARK